MIIMPAPFSAATSSAACSLVILTPDTPARAAMVIRRAFPAKPVVTRYHVDLNQHQLI